MKPIAPVDLDQPGFFVFGLKIFSIRLASQMPSGRYIRSFKLRIQIPREKKESMIMRRQLGTKRKVFEPLEKRLALAGNVTATLFSGGLLITGDNSANAILVEQIDADSFKVTGL